MGNVLADLKRASSAMFLSPGIKTPPANCSDGPPKVQHRHPEDESSPGARTNASSLKSTHYGMQGTKPGALYHQIQIDPEESEFHFAEKVNNERAREVHQQSHSMEEVARLANKETEKRLAEEVASAEDAARRGLLEKRLSEEAAASEEAANRSLHLKSLTTESHHRHQTMDGEADMQHQSHTQEKVTLEPLASGVNDSTASSSQNRAPDPIKSRREMMLARRERARSRQPPRLSSSPKRTTSSSVTTAAIPTTAPPATTTAFNQEAEAHKPNNNSSSHATTTAATRERYARHKKMLQQRKS